MGRATRTARIFPRVQRAAVVFAHVAACALATPAAAQQQARILVTCGDRDALTERLQLQFTESQTGIGISSGNVLIELWTSDETGTFTVLRTDSAGVSCIIGAGNFWTGSAPRLEGDPA